MSDAERNGSSDTPVKASRLPSPSCLFAVTLLVIVATVGGWFGWRVHRQRARIQHFERLGGVLTRPSRPLWLHDFVASRLGDDYAAGLTDIVEINARNSAVSDGDLAQLSLCNTHVTDIGLQHLDQIQSLELLYLENTQVTDAGVARLQARLPGCRILLINPMEDSAGDFEILINLIESQWGRDGADSAVPSE